MFKYRLFVNDHCILLLLVCMLFSWGNVYAQEPESETGNKKMTKEEFLQSLNPSSGKITLPGKIATIDLSEKFKYLDPANTERLLVNGWGNPPGNKTLGMVISSDVSPLDQGGWGVVISYDEDGHVKDSDADEIDYKDLLEDMKKQNNEDNKERKKRGYATMTLLGWAERPTYDKQTHKFYWAKEYSVSDTRDNALNYNIRVLGRKGVLVLNAVADMNQLNMIKQEMPNLLAETEFTPGNRYEDFDSKTDRIAEYGLAALVAGGVAAKMGLFGKLVALLLALKKFVVIGLVAVGAFIKSLFGRKKPEQAS